MQPSAPLDPDWSEPGRSGPAQPVSQQDGLSAADVRARLEFLSALGFGLLESGQTAGQTERALEHYGSGLGLEGLVTSSFGRMLLLEAAAARFRSPGPPAISTRSTAPARAS